MAAVLSGRTAVPGVIAHGRTQASCGSHISSFVTLDAHMRPQQCPCMTEPQSLEEGNGMKPLYTLLLCLPAALALIACGGGVAVLWPPAARPAAHLTVSRRRTVWGRADAQVEVPTKIPLRAVCIQRE